MPNRLTKLKVNFVSLVDRPANQAAVHVLAKRDVPQEDTMPDKPTATVDQPVVGITKADMDAAIASAIQKQTTEYQVKLDEASTTVAKLNKGLEETTQRAQQAEAVAKAEQDARETAVAIAKAEREMPALPGTTPAQVGPLLRKLSKSLTEEEYGLLETVLKSASVAIQKGDLFKERGSSYPVEGGPTSGQNAMDQINAFAKTFRDADPQLGVAASIVKAMDAHPDLVKQDRVEKGFARA